MIVEKTTNSYNDEIDLIELIISIWNKKWWVLSCTLVFGIGSILYAITAKEKWTSKAELIAPNIKAMGNYLDLYGRYGQITNQNQNQNEIVSKALFDSFSSAIGSYEKQVEFLTQSSVVNQKITDNSNVNLTILDLIESIHTQKPTKKDREKNINFLSVSFSAEKAAQAQTLLKEFIEYINHEVRETVVIDLLTEIETTIRTLKLQKESIKTFSDTAQKVRVANLKKALLVAKKAGILEYSLANKEGNTSFANTSGEAVIELKDNRLADDSFLFLLGERYLAAQVDTLTSTTPVYPAEYYQTELRINLLSDLITDQKNLNFDTFQYQSSPSLPLRLDKPKRSLIVLITTFIGGILGLLVALLVSTLEKRKFHKHSS